MLPFIVGLAAGAVAVVAYNNNKQIRKSVKHGAKKAKDIAENGYEKTKEFAGDLKANVNEKIDCLKSKKPEENSVEKIGSLEQKQENNINGN